MKVLVTGSEGFIGGYVVAELLRRGMNVVGVDNLSKYGRVNRAHHNHPNYELIVADARDQRLIYDQLLTCDHMIAGAARIGGIPYFHQYPYDLYAENEEITIAAGRAALAAHARAGRRLQKVTWLSSSMVYERASHWPHRETDTRVIPPPATSYGFQKAAVEVHARAAWDQRRLPYTIVRPFNCVGIGEARALGAPEVVSGNVKLAMSHVVPDLIHKVLAGQDPLHILGSGSQVRCYTYGGDLARGIVKAMSHDVAINEDFNLSTAEATTVLDLARLIWSKIHGPDRPLTVHHDPPYPSDVQHRVPDVDKARRVLAFTADTPLDTMLDEVIPWVRQAIKDGRL